MSENYEIVKGFQTEQGQALYDYDSLHGKPDINALISESEGRMQDYTDNKISEFKIPIDTSLSKEGEAADAKAVGDAIEKSKVQIDKDFINEGQAADAKAVGDALQRTNKAIEDSKVQIDPQLTEEGQAADAKATGLKIQEASNNTKQYIDEQLEQIQLEGVPYYGSEEEGATIENSVYATHLGGAPAGEFAKKTDVSNLGASIEERLNSDFISQSNIEQIVDSKGYAKIEEVDSKIENLTAEQVGAAPASHATDKNNPHGVTAEQVGARPSDWTPTAAEVGARPATWMPSASDVGASPMEYTKKVGNPHNLLDNSDFRNPVNQRGITTHNGGGYSIDRWFTTGGENGEQFQVRVEDGYVKLYNGSDVQHGLEQRFVHGILDQNKVYTVAYKDYYGNVVVSRASIGYYPEYGMDALYFPLNPGETRLVVWIALYEGEYTAETLPEYQPKGYGAELAECQRYYLKLSQIIPMFCFDSGNRQIRGTLSAPTKMRDFPRVENHHISWIFFGGYDTSTGSNTTIAVNEANDGIDVTVGLPANITPEVGSIHMVSTNVWLSADL